MVNCASINLINCDKSSFEFVKQRLNTSQLDCKINVQDDNYSENNHQLSILGCDYACSLKRCLKNYYFCYLDRKAPLVLVRSAIYKKKDTQKNKYIISRHDRLNLSSTQENIFNKIKNSVYSQSPTDEFLHPTDPLYKIIKAQQIIADNPSNRISLQDLSDKINLSQAWLSFIFKKMSGLTIEQYSIKIRYCYALWQIFSTEKLIKTIAIEQGYKPLSFTKRFTSMFGIPPSEVRNKISSILK